ncbi:DMT family transporter [Halanaeroarchaeum sp. HSR-CO]|uniref:DMT family transporter n=1 Tax=Halanaeroarchaeum sp. HSR-CO TaxID=2866382 RepID=UPI00217D8F86|nr:DMT family transporter [Halanaeroarchaeum sp. HSR-CO]
MAVVAVAIVAVSTSAILVRLSEAPSLVKAFYRVLFTTAFILPFAGRYREAFGRIGRRDLLFAVVSGIALAVHFAAWFESLEWTSVAASVTLVQVQPIFVAVGAWALLDEHLNARMVGGILVALVGAAILSGAGLLGEGVVGANPLYGNLLAIVGAIMAAGYVLAGRSLRQRLPLVPYVLVVYGVAAVALFGFVVIEGAALSGYPPREWVLFVAMAVGPGLLGHTLINWALKYVESSVISVSLLGEPVGSAILALFIFTEIPGTATVVGGSVVLLGIFVTARARQV